MLKNKKIVIVLAVALVCLIVAAALLVAFLTPIRTTFYVFKDTYKAGTTITGDMLTPVQADSRLVVAGGSSEAGTYFITSENLSSYIQKGDVLRTDVKKGEALMLTHVSKSGSSEVEVKMAPNAVAITVPVNSIKGVTPDLKSESHVNVYVSYKTGETELLLENIRVLSVQKDEDSLEGASLELTNEQALAVVAAVESGNLYLGMVNSEGYIYENTAG